MKVSDLMTAVVATCGPSDSLNRAAQIMWEQRCGSVPVVDETGAPAGMLTDRDAAMAAYTQGRRLDDISVSTAMSRPVWSCAATAPVEEAEGLMMAHGVRRLAVVDPQGRLVGVLSLDDIARGATAWDGKGEIDLERVAVTLGEISRRTRRYGEEDPGEDGSALAEVVRNGVEALKTLRQEIGADLGLAGEEAKKRWMRLEARFHAAELRVRATGHVGARHLAELLEHAHQFRSRLEVKRPPRNARQTDRA